MNELTKANVRCYGARPNSHVQVCDVGHRRVQYVSLCMRQNYTEWQERHRYRYV